MEMVWWVRYAQALDKAWDAAVSQLIEEALALDHKERARGLS
jgi:hypothetical protein